MSLAMPLLAGSVYVVINNSRDREMKVCRRMRLVAVAAMCAAGNTPVSELDVEALRAALVEDGVFLEEYAG